MESHYHIKSVSVHRFDLGRLHWNNEDFVQTEAWSFRSNVVDADRWRFIPQKSEDNNFFGFSRRKVGHLRKEPPSSESFEISHNAELKQTAWPHNISQPENPPSCFFLQWHFALREHWCVSRGLRRINVSQIFPSPPSEDHYCCGEWRSESVREGGSEGVSE